MGERLACGMGVRLAGALGVLAVVAPGCGQGRPRIALECQAGARAVERALSAAPAPVRLPSGTPLSQCVEKSVTDADLQNTGALFTDVADRLAREVPGSDAAAVRLGYLVGATERGARHTNGVGAELVNRMNGVLGLSGGPPARRAAFARGRAAGLSDG